MATVRTSLNAHSVKELAARLGFDACAIACAGDIDPSDQLGEWIRSDFHADMSWMARTLEVRRDVQKKLPDTRSVIVVARNYFSRRPEPSAGQARVSRYAWGRDYHRVLYKPLRKLAGHLEACGAHTYCCIDSGPVMEKAWAARSGLGWIGKNSLVLRRELGSYFFLGVILTTAELSPDQPVPDQCGSCRLCIDACPTGAIVRDRVVDSRLCISYQTIENRNDIPLDLQSKTSDWLFGCDICQDVCPWNRKLRETNEPDFLPRPGHANPDLAKIESMREDEYLAEFAGTPLMRAKFHGLQRNGRIVRKNMAETTGDARKSTETQNRPTPAGASGDIPPRL